MTTDLHVLIVDDEPLGRRAVRELVDELADVAEIREAPNGSDAIRMIREHRPDLVFLDVQMPRIDGFRVIESIGARDMPPVIFVTAYDEHALRAFEVHAVDYLLKPIDPNRFRDAVDRARRIMAADGVESLRVALAALLPTVRQAREVLASGVAPRSTAPIGATRIPVRTQGRVVFVDPREIDWVESLGNYVRLHGRGRSLRRRATMDDMEAELGPAFIRIRRSVLVRAGAILYCEPMGKGSWVVVLHDQTRLTSSRYYRNQLGALLGERSEE
jgi:two-component system LytT family response regulator